MQNYHNQANKQNLTPGQRADYFQLGAEIQSNKTVKLGFRVCPEYCHNIAMNALKQSGWKIKVARLLV